MREIEGKQSGLKLGLHHFAAFRGHLDGLSPEVLGDRYLETGADAVQAKRTINFVRHELIAAAKRHARATGVTQASFARLLRANPDVLSVDEKVELAEIPSLEDFQADHDPHGFWSARELIQEFETRYASPLASAALRKAERNERLRRRVRDALTVLEGYLATTPKPSDPISIWLHPLISRKLTTPATGIVTIKDLVYWINSRGNLWFRKMEGIGATKAQRIVAWLQLNKVLPINEFALVPFKKIKDRLPAARPKAAGIVPLEALQMPAELDGSQGINRGRDNRLSANDDKAAVEAWISIKAKASRNTARSYRSQAERFLLWSLFELGKPLSSVTAEECAAYLAFLEDLGDAARDWTWNIAREDWIAGKAAQRWHPDWRPFTGTLSVASRRQAVIVLKGLFAFLTRTKYLDHDPWLELETPRKVGGRINVRRALLPHQWSLVQDELEEREHDEAYLRLRLALWLLYTSGLRLFEIASLRREHMLRDAAKNWTFKVLGKGGKEREIPLAPAVLEMMSDYLEVRGLGRDPAAWAPETPILATLGGGLQHAAEGGKNLADSSLFKVLKRHFELAALRADDLIDRDALKRCSTHWLRHTFATELLAAGAGQEVAQELLGHADPGTTAIYVHASEARKRAAVEALTRNR